MDYYPKAPYLFGITNLFISFKDKKYEYIYRANKNIKIFFVYCACTAVIATTPTISSALHPLDKSLTGLAIP